MRIPDHVKARGKARYQLFRLRIQRPTGEWETVHWMDGSEMMGYYGHLVTKKYVTGVYEHLFRKDNDFRKITNDFKKLYKALHENDVDKAILGSNILLPIDKELLKCRDAIGMFKRYTATLAFVREGLDDPDLYEEDVIEMQDDLHDLEHVKSKLKEGASIKELKKILGKMLPLKDYMKFLYGHLTKNNIAGFNEVLFDYFIDNRAANASEALLIFVKLIDKEILRKFLINEMRVLAFHHRDKLCPRMDILLMKLPFPDDPPGKKAEFVRFEGYRVVKKQGIRTTGKLAGRFFVFESACNRMRLECDDYYYVNKPKNNAH